MNYINYKTTLNGVENASKTLAFNNTPNLLTIASTNTSGQKARAVLTIKGGEFSPTETYYISVNGVKVYATDVLSKVGNTSFYITSETTTSANNGMSYYLTKALLSTPLINSYKIYLDHQGSGQANVIIEALEKGAGYNLKIETNLPSAMFSNTKTIGSTFDTLVGSRILVDLYVRENSPAFVGGQQMITLKPWLIQLEKTYVKDSVTFDLSSVLSNHTKNNELTAYDIVINGVDKSGYLELISTVKDNFALNGYEENFEVLTNTFLQKINADTKLYYVDKITYSLLPYVAGAINITYSYYNSAMQKLGEDMVSYTKANLMTIEYNPLPIPNTYYITVDIPDVGSIKYENINPLKYGDNLNYETLYFNNSMGGVSFFPFTASNEEEYESEKKTYKPNFTNNVSMVYENKVERTKTLRSHYLPKGGLDTLRDLYKSENVWKVDKNGNKEYVVIDDMTFDEIQHGLYQVTLSYKNNI